MMQVKHISAQPGQPSTFWSQDGKHWYKDKKSAEQNDTDKAVNPEDYVMTKSFWAQNKNTLIVCLATVIILGVLFWCWHKGVITFHLHKS